MCVCIFPASSKVGVCCYSNKYVPDTYVRAGGGLPVGPCLVCVLYIRMCTCITGFPFASSEAYVSLRCVLCVHARRGLLRGGGGVFISAFCVMYACMPVGVSFSWKHSAGRVICSLQF